jgi:hypothetical protein
MVKLKRPQRAEDKDSKVETFRAVISLLELPTSSDYNSRSSSMCFMIVFEIHTILFR